MYLCVEFFFWWGYVITCDCMRSQNQMVEIMFQRMDWQEARHNKSGVYGVWIERNYQVALWRGRCCIHSNRPIQSPVHGSCCRADCCCLLLIIRADQSASSSGGKGMWGGRRCMTSYFCCLLLSLLTRKSVSPTAGGETGARGDSD